MRPIFLQIALCGALAAACSSGPAADSFQRGKQNQGQAAADGRDVAVSDLQNDGEVVVEASRRERNLNASPATSVSGGPPYPESGNPAVTKNRGPATGAPAPKVPAPLPPDPDNPAGSIESADMPASTSGAFLVCSYPAAGGVTYLDVSLRCGLRDANGAAVAAESLLKPDVHLHMADGRSHRVRVRTRMSADYPWEVVLGRVPAAGDRLSFALGLGGNRQNLEIKAEKLQGTPPQMYRNWDHMEPSYLGSGLIEDCVEIWLERTAGAWNDVDCRNNVRPFACRSLTGGGWAIGTAGPYTRQGSCPAGYEFSWPKNAAENQDLTEQMQVEGVAKVWLKIRRELGIGLRFIPGN